MKKILLVVTAAFLITLLIPLAMLLKYGKYVVPEAEDDRTVTVYIKSEDKVATMRESQYLKEVVSAEMPEGRGSRRCRPPADAAQGAGGADATAAPWCDAGLGHGAGLAARREESRTCHRGRMD